MAALALLSISCQKTDTDDAASMYEVDNTNYNINMTTEVLLTAESGEKLSRQDNIAFREGRPQGNLIVIRPDIVKQAIDGIGTSFTESSAFVLAHLDRDKRQEVMNNIYGENGANFSLARTMIGASDLSVEGR